jgi:hypothetical protein
MRKILPGMLLFIDFEKACDSLEWKYLFKVLDVMNLGPMFRKWIHTFYFNITSCVKSNGYARVRLLSAQLSRSTGLTLVGSPFRPGN